MTGEPPPTADDGLRAARVAGGVLAEWVRHSPGVVGTAVLIVVAAVHALSVAGWNPDVALIVLHEFGPARLMIAAIVTVLPYLLLLAVGIAGAYGFGPVSTPTVVICAVLFVLSAPVWLAGLGVPVVLAALFFGRGGHSEQPEPISRGWHAVPVLLAGVLLYQIASAPVLPREQLRVTGERSRVTGMVLRETEAALRVLKDDGELQTLATSRVAARRLCPRAWYEEPIVRALSRSRGPGCS